MGKAQNILTTPCIIRRAHLKTTIIKIAQKLPWIVPIVLQGFKSNLNMYIIEKHTYRILSTWTTCRLDYIRKFCRQVTWHCKNLQNILCTMKIQWVAHCETTTNSDPSYYWTTATTRWCEKVSLRRINQSIDQVKSNDHWKQARNPLFPAFASRMKI